MEALKNNYLVILFVFFISVCVLLYINTLHLKQNITIKDNEISSLILERDLANQSLSSLRFLREEQDKISLSKQEATTSLKEVTNNTITEIRNKIGKGNEIKENEASVLNSPLDPDLVRMLNSLCQQANSGKECPNP